MKNVKLERVSAQNFKCFNDETFEFSDSTLISGQNATGKTSVLDAVWFCLFGTNCNGDSKFERRPLDENGNKIHGTVISVETAWNVDGQSIVLKRSERENWVKKRGTDVQTLQGNVGEYEVNGFPNTAADYDRTVSEIVGNKEFKILTNPAYFASLPWKEQREIVMSTIDIGSDAEIARSIGGYDEILEELQVAPGTDAIKQKYSKGLKELKKKQEELPIRIDEISKSKVDFDVASLAAERKALQNKTNEIEQMIVSGGAEQKKASIEADITALEADKRKIQAEAQYLVDEARQNAKANLLRASVVSDEENELSALVADNDRFISSSKSEISYIQEELERITKSGTSLNAEWKTLNESEFDATAEICPTCGRPLDPEDIERHKAEFDQRKADEKKLLMSKAEKMKARRAEITEKINSLSAEINKRLAATKSANEQIDALKAARDERIAECRKKLDELPVAPDMSGDKAYADICMRLDEKRKEYNAITESGATQLLKSELSDKREELSEIDAMLARAAQNASIDNRIASLRDEQMETAQKVADAEKIVALVESFVRAKMELVAEKIGEAFGPVRFKLFETQINGGLAETCEMSYDGVPYSALNNGHRIIAGLHVIIALQRMFDVKTPIFIDNAESVNEWRLPVTNCQCVLMRVSNDNKLTLQQ